MTTMQHIIVGIFRDRAQAEQAIHELLQAGLGHHQIRFAGREASTGGIMEKIKSLFTGQDMSEANIDDDLVKMGIPPEDARYYQSEFEAGHSIVAVQANGRMQEVSTILARHGGYGINQRATAQTTGYGQAATQGTDYGKAATQSTDYGKAATQSTDYGKAATQSTDYDKAASTQPSTTEGEQRIKLREEELRARKQTTETGEARLHKDVVAEQKSMEVPVTREEVYIEHRPGSGLPSDQPIGKEETYRIPVHEEQVTTEKRPIEREEVVFGKQPVQQTQQVSDTVQREEVHVEQTGDVNIRDKGVKRGGDIKQGRDINRGRGIDRSGDIDQGRDIDRSGDIDDYPGQIRP